MTTTNILLRYSSLGDLVLCTALVSKLKNETPNDPIIFVSKPEFRDFILKRFPHPKLSFMEGGKGLLNSFQAGYRLGTKLKATASHLRLMDLHGNLKSCAFALGLRIASWISKVPTTVHHSSRHSFARTLSVLFHNDFLGQRHVFRDHLKTLSGSLNYFPELKAFDRTPRTRERILVAPDAQHWKKRWIVAHWESLLEHLLRHPRQFELTLVGSAQCLPMDVLDNIQALGGDRVENLLGKTALVDLPDIAANHDLTLCSNSAWLHISEAVQVPVVSLSGPIVPGFGFSPWRPQSRELSVDLDCRPCTKHGGGRCSKSGLEFHACMRNIEPNRVYQEVLSVLRISP